MFGRNNGGPEAPDPTHDQGQAEPPTFTLPELRSFRIFYFDKDGGEHNNVFGGHSLQMTEAGGMNVTEIVVQNMTPIQKVRFAWAPNMWRFVEEVFPLPPTGLVI